MPVDLGAPIRERNDDVIKAGTTRIASLSAIVAGLAAIDVTFSDNLVEIFGDTPPTAGIKTTILVALIAAWAVIAVADLFSRAITTAASSPKLVTTPGGIEVRRADQQGTSAERGWIVVAAEAKPAKPEATKLLVVKSGQKPEWVDASTVKGD